MLERKPLLEKPINVLFEDSAVIVFDKPSGLVVIPTPNIKSNTLVNIVNYQFRTNTDSVKLHPCHRLDIETSGAIIFAKGKNNQKIMMELFKERAVKKKYIAIVHGRMAQKQGELKSSIKSLDESKFGRKTCAKFSITKFKVLETKPFYSLVEVEPVTGRTNQIRIQFAEIGHPLLGERKYTFAKNYKLRFKRVALHASEIEWGGLKGERIKVVSNLPKDMKTFLDNN